MTQDIQQTIFECENAVHDALKRLCGDPARLRNQLGELERRFGGAAVSEAFQKLRFADVRRITFSARNRHTRFKRRRGSDNSHNHGAGMNRTPPVTVKVKTVRTLS